MAFFIVFVVCILLLTAAIARQRRRWLAPPYRQRLAAGSIHGSKNEKERHHGLSLIEPLPAFDWKTTPPLKLRPFKPTYNITMAIQSATPSDLIVMDAHYLDRVTARRQLIADHTSAVYGATPSGHAPVRELYRYLLGTYLPTRYPTMFELVTTDPLNPLTQPDSKTSAGVIFRNKVTNCTFPLHPPPADPLEMLRILAETVEDDLFLLLRDDNSNDGIAAAAVGNGGGGGEHRAVAFVCCHPSGFDPSTKLGKKLVDIHGPVPAYEKIGASMERFFGRLEVGRGVRRMNWAIQTHPRLYAPSGNHVHAGDDVAEETDADLRQARFRVELQTLTRLPETRAILFSFKTHLYSLDEIKAEGLGPDLAEAIEGLKVGNAPGMWVYKGAVRWGRVVCEYLRERVVVE